MPRARGGDEFDTTSLTSTTHGWRVHRDYLAHVLRWGWAGRWIGKHGTSRASRVIEPGCGTETPLFGVMRAQQSYLPDLYLGVDIGPIGIERKRKPGSYPWAEFRSHTDFTEAWPKLLEEFGPTFDLCVSFEVIEHMSASHQPEYLRGCFELLQPGGTLLISTPCFNGHAAKNHVRELTIDELRDLLEAAGFAVLRRYGTFASYHDVKRGLHDVYPDDAKALLTAYETIREFYDDNMLAGFLAPLLPDYSRNNAWVCRKPGDDVALVPRKHRYSDDDMRYLEGDEKT